ncbi:MAG: efflux RND transporter periplasmic adaptor subunit [bacterium]|nr:efflux RND transporter periplasmic adaptor subunit [bacterium]
MIVRPRNALWNAPICSLACVTAMVWLGCGTPEAPDAPLAKVARGSIERVVVATGTVEPAVEVEVRPRIAGIIEGIPVKAGELVEAGQVLVEIEKELLRAQVREASAALQATNVETRYAEIGLHRAEKLEQTGAASAEKLDDARSRFETAQASRARAQARLDTLSTQLGYASVVAPMAGRVLEVHEEEGSAVSPVTAVTGGTLLVTLAGTEALHLEGLVDENEVARVVVGQVARIRTEAFGDRIFEGRVSEIAPMGERIQNVTYFEVEVSITDLDAKMLRPRMSGDGEIVADTIEAALWVPETALRYEGADIYVEVQNGEGFDRRSVTIGIVDRDRVQILGGVEEGEEVRLQ